METDDSQLDEYLNRIEEQGVEPVSIDPLMGDHGIFAVETEVTIDDETFTGEVDYAIEDDGIRVFFLEIYLDEDDERKPVLDESSADEIDKLLYEYKPSEDEIEDTVEVLREVHTEVYA